MTDEPPSELTTKIVAAYVRRNEIAPDQLATLISTVHQALIGRGKPAETVSSARTPAVTVRRSVQHDRVTCLECGWTGSVLRRHLTTRHGLTPDEYRTRWSLPREHALVAPAYSARRSELAKQNGLGRGGRRVAGDAAALAASQPRRRGRPRSAATPAYSRSDQRGDFPSPERNARSSSRDRHAETDDRQGNGGRPASARRPSLFVAEPAAYVKCAHLTKKDA